MPTSVSYALDDDGIDERFGAFRSEGLDGKVDFSDGPGLVEEWGLWELFLESSGPGGELVGGTAAKEPDCAGDGINTELTNSGRDGAVPC